MERPKEKMSNAFQKSRYTDEQTTFLLFLLFFALDVTMTLAFSVVVQGNNRSVCLCDFVVIEKAAYYEYIHTFNSSVVYSRAP